MPALSQVYIEFLDLVAEPFDLPHKAIEGGEHRGSRMRRSIRGLVRGCEVTRSQSDLGSAHIAVNVLIDRDGVVMV
jgi:hypothetical protein